MVFKELNFFFVVGQGDDENKSKRALAVLAELNRRKVWVDERTSNAICNACFHKSSRYTFVPPTSIF